MTAFLTPLVIRNAFFSHVSKCSAERRVIRVTRSECADFILRVHYAHRWPSISHAFGLFRDDELEGIVTFGKPASSPLRKGICGPDYASYVIELNRLCLLNNLKGDASFLVSHAVRKLPKPAIIVSFADTSRGHLGTVYQACNFIYCGLSAKRTDWKVRGKEHLHGQTIADEFRGHVNRAEKMKEKYGDDFYLADRSRKHRYVRFVGSRGFKKKAAAHLRYEKTNYPKAVME